MMFFLGGGGGVGVGVGGVGGGGVGGGGGGGWGGFMYFPWHNVVTHQPLGDALELMIFKLVSKLDILSISYESGLK